jgi:hypothetical protein
MQQSPAANGTVILAGDSPPPIDERAEDPFVEIGNSGLKRQSGIITQDPLKELQGLRGVRVFQEMEANDPIIGALLYTIDTLIRGVDWTVEPGQDGGDEADAQFIEEAMNDMEMPFKEVISEILSMLTFGWSFHEIVYKQRRGPQLSPVTDPVTGKVEIPPSSRFSDGKTGWHKIAGRAQDTLQRWVFDEDNGSILGMIQSAAPSYEFKYVPLSKAMLFRTNTRYNNPEGRSILRNAYRPWFFKTKIENIQGIGIERDLAGLPVLHIPPEYLSSDATATQKAIAADMKEMIRNIRRDEQEGALVPRVYDKDGNSMFELELLSTGGRRQFDTREIMAMYDARMAMTSMADFVLLGHEIHGSFALADNKTELLAAGLGATMDLIADQFNRKGIPKLLLLNGRPVENPPQLKHGDIEAQDLAQLGSFLQQMTTAGFEMGDDRNLEDHLRRAAGLPERGSETSAAL